jgi:hypothetical protein
MKNKDNSSGKPVVIVKHLHSCCASSSSNDEWLYIETTKDKIDFEVNEDIQIKESKNIPAVSFDKIEEITENGNLLTIYLESDKRFYNRSLRQRREDATKEEMDELVKLYIDKGFSKEEPLIKNINYQQKKQVENMFRKNLGFVLIDYEKDRNPEEFQGGLSDKLFKNKILQDYLKSIAFGYIGAFGRTFSGDRLVEKTLREHNFSDTEISLFMTSRSGRHFADGLGSYDSFENDKEHIKNKLIGYMEDAYNSFIKEEVEKLKK